eukprot:TRINITY_DN30098_c0_g1_i1.p2 TRINITY_DN30098_c0_g1~~TRINITY_DN30098_c0_g1_i1.p2  ORF type:complete len:160 (-),score=43.69 TRINITY_DN30098_c0_g1_i1:1028-1453(-)
MPLYNDAREYYNLSRVSNFSQISSNPEIGNILATVYDSVDNIDALVGGLAEDHTPLSTVGPLFLAAIIDQYHLLRDGDRFFYMSRDANFSLQEQDKITQTRLADVILRNTERGVYDYLDCLLPPPFLTTRGIKSKLVPTAM